MFDEIDDIVKIGFVAGVGIVGFAFYQKWQSRIQDQKIDTIYSDAAQNGSAAEFAKQFRRAFDNCGFTGCYGTDEEALQKLVKDIPTKKFLKQVETEYFKITNGSSLQLDLFEELTGWGNTASDNALYDKLISELNTKPNG